MQDKSVFPRKDKNTNTAMEAGTDSTAPNDLREAFLESNVIHHFDEGLIRRNLAGCYGKLMAKFYERIITEIKGRNIVDCGCGFGLFSNIAIRRGFKVTPIDVDEESLKIAREMYNLPGLKESIYKTSLPDGSQDAVIFFDVIEHLDIEKLFLELNRLGVRQVLVYDSNLRNPLLRFFRRMIKHKEHQEYSPQEVMAKFSGNGFRLNLERYENVVSLPISGGLLQRPLPFISRFHNAIYYFDSGMAAILRIIGLDKYFGLRYLLGFIRE